MSDATAEFSWAPPKEGTGPELPRPKPVLFIGDVATRSPQATLLYDWLIGDQVPPEK